MFSIPGRQAVTLTPAAVRQVRRMMDRDGRHGLRIGVKKGGCAGMEYTMEWADAAGPLDAVVEQDGTALEVGVCRYISNPDGETCEFALVVADAWQHKGIGHRLMGALMDIARDKGLKTMEGEVLGSNRNMLGLVASLGFSVGEGDEPTIRKVVKRF